MLSLIHRSTTGRLPSIDVRQVGTDSVRLFLLDTMCSSGAEFRAPLRRALKTVVQHPLR
jgi:hypothetical protein